MLWLTPLVGAVLDGDDHSEDAAIGEAIGVIGLSLANVGAVAVGLRHERLGGRILVLTGTVFSAFAIVTAGRNHALAAAVSGGPLHRDRWVVHHRG